MRSTLHPMLAIAFMFMLLGAMSGCSYSHREEAPLRIGLNEWIGYQPLFWAQERYLQKGDFDLIELPNNTESVRLFQNRALDIACLTLDETLQLTKYDDEIIILAVLDFSNGADALVVHEGINVLSELKGKRIGYEYGAVGTYMLERILAKAQLDKAHISTQPLALHQHAEAFLEKEVDGVITFEPVISRLTQQGGVTLFDSSHIPGEIIDVLVTRKSFLTQHSKKIAGLLDAWFRAAGDITAKEPAAYDYLAELLQIDSTHLNSQFDLLGLPDKQASKTFLLSDAYTKLQGSIYAILTQSERNGDASVSPLVEKEILEALY